jgi:hypothetical protein
MSQTFHQTLTHISGQERLSHELALVEDISETVLFGPSSESIHFLGEKICFTRMLISTVEFHSSTQDYATIR